MPTFFSSFQLRHCQGRRESAADLRQFRWQPKCQASNATGGPPPQPTQLHRGGPATEEHAPPNQGSHAPGPTWPTHARWGECFNLFLMLSLHMRHQSRILTLTGVVFALFQMEYMILFICPNICLPYVCWSKVDIYLNIYHHFTCPIRFTRPTERLAYTPDWHLSLLRFWFMLSIWRVYCGISWLNFTHSIVLSIFFETNIIFH